jgi:hypothetical protein
MAGAASSITASAAAAGGHGKLVLGGPLFVFLQVFGYAALLGAIAVGVDSLRRPAADFAGSARRRWLWAGPQLLFLALLAVAWTLTLARIGVKTVVAPLAGFLVIYLLICVILQIAYLLVVVFPRHRMPEVEIADRAAER